MQLQQQIQQFDDAGIGIIAITYDSPELQQAFIQQAGLTYPLMSDVDAFTMKALGILNEDYEPDDFGYGIPHPGAFVINPAGEIVGKIFVEAYSSRVTADSTLAYAKETLGVNGRSVGSQ